MKCTEWSNDEAKSRIIEYVTNRMDGDEEEEFRRHLLYCDHCTDYVDAIIGKKPVWEETKIHALK